MRKSDTLYTSTRAFYGERMWAEGDYDSFDPETNNDGSFKNPISEAEYRGYRLGWHIGRGQGYRTTTLMHLIRKWVGKWQRRK